MYRLYLFLSFLYGFVMAEEINITWGETTSLDPHLPSNIYKKLLVLIQPDLFTFKTCDSMSPYNPCMLEHARWVPTAGVGNPTYRCIHKVDGELVMNKTCFDAVKNWDPTPRGPKYTAELGADSLNIVSYAGHQELYIMMSRAEAALTKYFKTIKHKCNVLYDLFKFFKCLIAYDYPIDEIFAHFTPATE